jgi:hypothetical protein
MAVTDRKVHKDAKVAVKTIVVPLITATGQADLKAFSTRPGFGFEVVGVETFCSGKAGTVTANVKIGTASVLSGAASFTAGSRVSASLAASASARRGTSTSDLNVHYTTDGTGALTNGFVVVRIRPYPLNGDVA